MLIAPPPSMARAPYTPQRRLSQLHMPTVSGPPSLSPVVQLIRQSYRRLPESNAFPLVTLGLLLATPSPSAGFCATPLGR